MKITYKKFIATADQYISSSTSPLFVLISFLSLSIADFAVSAQVIFLYGCLASLLQSALSDPYLIANKFLVGRINIPSYYSAACIGASGISILSLPILIIITQSYLLSFYLCLCFAGMLVQDQIRFQCIQEERNFRLILSDSAWITLLLISILVSKSENLSTLLSLWTTSGLFALLLIVDVKQIKKFSFFDGYNLLRNNAKYYSYTFVETLLCGLLLILCNWLIGYFLGDRDISTYRLLALFFGVSTVIINRHRIFDFAYENMLDDIKVNVRQVYRRIYELGLVVVLNFLMVCFLLFYGASILNFELIVNLGVGLLLVAGVEKLSVGALMSITVFHKAHESPRRIAWIRTGTVFISTVLCGVVCLLGAELVYVLILNSFVHLIVCIFLLYKIFLSYSKK